MQTQVSVNVNVLAYFVHGKNTLGNGILYVTGLLQSSDLQIINHI